MFFGLIAITILLTLVPHTNAQSNFEQSTISLKEAVASHFQAIYNNKLYIINFTPTSSSIAFPFVAGDQWQTSSINTNGRNYFYQDYYDQTVQVNDKLYFLYQDIWYNSDIFFIVFSLTTNTFIELTHSGLTERKCVTYSSLTDTIYMIGDNKPYTVRFDPSSGNFLTDGSEPSVFRLRHGCSMNAAGDSYYVFGGYISTFVSSIERYDVVNDIWHSVAATLSVARSYSMCRLMAGLIYCLGGKTSTIQRMDVVDVFDPSTEEMLAHSLSLTQVKDEFAASVWDDRCLIVTGGYNNGPVKTIETFGDCSTESPTKHPSKFPTTQPTMHPTNNPSMHPSKFPTIMPTKAPTVDPTFDPTADPTNDPTQNPTTEPTVEPTRVPSVDPTFLPSANPTNDPSQHPTTEPTVEPTLIPSLDPTFLPSVNPTDAPSKLPTKVPSSSPIVTFEVKEPTNSPTNMPTVPLFIQIGAESSSSSNALGVNLYILIGSAVFLLVVCVLVIIIALLVKKLKQKDKMNQQMIDKGTEGSTMQMQRIKSNTVESIGNVSPSNIENTEHLNTYENKEMNGKDSDDEDAENMYASKPKTKGAEMITQGFDEGMEETEGNV